MGKKDALNNFSHREIAVYEGHVKKMPEDARARVLLASNYAMQGRMDEAKREVDMAMILRPDDSMILYNAACLFCAMNNVPDALKAIRKAGIGLSQAVWTRQYPTLSCCWDESLRVLSGGERSPKAAPESVQSKVQRSSGIRRGVGTPCGTVGRPVTSSLP